MSSKKKRKGSIVLIIIELVVIIVLGIILTVNLFGCGGSDTGETAKQQEETKPSATPAPTSTPTPTPTPEPTLTPEEEAKIREEEEAKARKEAAGPVLERAALFAMMYDYDSAVAEIETIPGYEKDAGILQKYCDYELAKTKLVKWPDNTQITHIFVHSLIVENERAFRKGSSQPVGYNRYMTTVDEFKRMLEQMYERGFVLISIHDMAHWEDQPDGSRKLVATPIMLPEGKRPFVLSQDDVNYYDYMKGDGFATRILPDAEGKPTCEYITADGEKLYGDYDMVPIVDSFVEEHPDFSYHGAKGIVAVTGYEGTLGYDTGWHQHDLDTEEGKKELEELQAQAKLAADCLKEDGWEFASHSYTHTNMTTNSVEKLIYDTDKWKREVEPLVGETDIYLYPFGADICDWRGYKGEKYEYLKNAGFVFFCNVDASEYWVQIRDEYVRQGRINTDGERMMKTPEKLEFMFDVDYVLDHTRPPLD